MPDTPSTNCLVRISDTDGSPTDQSDAVFAITEITFISDLAVSDFQFLPQTISVGATPDLVSYRLTNLGPADLTPPNTYVNESIVLSENTTIGDGDDIDIFLYSNDYFLSSGNYTDNIPSYLYQYMIIPHVPTGDYYIFFEVQHSSPSSALIDPNLSNNYVIRSGTIHIINESQIPSIDIASPNGGETWQVGSTQNISWASNETSGNVRIEYSIDNGSSWTDIVTNTPDDGSYSWTIPNTPSTTCLVRITDTDGSPTDQSNAVFSISAVPTINLTSPNGGEVWLMGSNQVITWNSSNTSGNVRIEYSINNGSNWTEIVTSTQDDGSYPWVIPNTPSESCLVRISDVDGSPIGQSYAVFTIGPVQINVIAPNGGETWQVGSTHNISWISSGNSGSVRIEYSTNNGSSWTGIVTNTPDIGSYAWTVPNTPSTTCLVRISDTDGSPTDQSNEVFAIATVTVAVTGVSVQPTTMNLYAGNSTGTVVATIDPANATNKSVTWSSSNIAVATVSSTGVVTPLSVGTANIIATTDDGGFNATCEVTVETPPCIVPETPVIVSITQPSCSVATGSVVLTNLPPSGSWTLTVNLNGAIIDGTGTDYTVTGLTSGTHSFTVTNESGCTSLPSENVVIIPNPSTPAAPSIGLITQPTCNIPNGSVTLNGLPTIGNWTLTQNPDGIIRSGTGVSITVTDLSPGIYSYTITNCW